MSNAKITILLGAGFSKSVFPEFPTMRELTKSVFENEEVEPLIRALDKQLPLFEGKELHQVNIEEWFQILEESSAYFKDLTIHSRRRLIIDVAMKVIAKKIQELSKSIVFSDSQLEHFKKLLSCDVNIITTNYDLIFERAIEELILRGEIEISTPYDLNIGSIEMAYQKKGGTYLSAGRAPRDKFARIYKLHGSCDWFTSELEASEQIYADINLLRDYLKYEYRVESSEICEHMSLVIAGPNSMKSKLINSKALRPIWTAAYSALRGTSRLIVFGTSIHKSDATLNSLLVEGLPVSTSVDIFDLEPEPIADRLKSLTVRSSISSRNSDAISFESFVDTVVLYSNT